MPRINIDIPDELHKKAKYACVLKDTTLIEYINQLIADELGKD